MVHLTKLQRQFHDYFPEKHHWIDNPFGINMELNEENYLKKKTGERSRFYAEHDLKVAPSTITP